MLSVALVNNPVPVPIVNTTLPGTTITHVPYDTVAPSISNAQVNNNASPNSGAPVTEAQDEPASGQISATAAASIAANSAVQNPTAQAAFLAQLLSQDASPPVQTILVQYEKLVAFSNVKYKPSNASKPVAEPANIFGKLLQENTPTAPPVTRPEPAPEQPTSSTAPAVEQNTVTSNPVPDTSPPRETAADIATSNQTSQVISAYKTTAARVDIQNTALTTASA